MEEKMADSHSNAWVQSCILELIILFKYLITFYTLTSINIYVGASTGFLWSFARVPRSYFKILRALHADLLMVILV